MRFNPTVMVCVIMTILCGAPFANSQEFHGYNCTQDCSGHEAGYEWAEMHGITDPDTCGGNSNSFIEGCMAYAEEFQEMYGEDEEEGWFTGDSEYCEDYPEECEDEWD